MATGLGCPMERHSTAGGGPVYDLVVIGAGMGGLAAAALAQRLGIRTALLEAHAKLGGCAGISVGGLFMFDAGATALMGLDPTALRDLGRSRFIMMLDALVVAPHPDDAELGMGGTIVRLIRQGWSVGILDLTSGEPTPLGSPERRAEETAAATAELGDPWRRNLGLPNRSLEPTLAHRRVLA